jgi:molybdate transport system ATP-binding protein
MMLEVEIEGQVGSMPIQVQLAVAGGRLVLVGRNGAGKTSVLLMMLGLLRARGRIAVDGQVLLDSAAGVDLPPEDRGLGYVPQNYALFPHLTALENVAFGLGCKPPRPAAGQRRRRAFGLLESVDAATLADRYPASLSGGEKQRVALARALAASPRALLLDEPLAALDATIRNQLRAFLASRLAALELPALLVTHDAVDAKAFGYPVAVLERGRIVQTGSLDELRANPATPFVAEFFSGRE